MPIFSQGDIVRVPFPYTDRDTRQRRPALIVSDGAIGEQGALLWVVMITSADNRPWAGDVTISDHLAAGLPAPSTIRPTKIATVEARHVETIGRVNEAARLSVLAAIGSTVGLTSRQHPSFNPTD